jgi:Fe-S-cluster containining protein
MSYDGLIHIKIGATKGLKDLVNRVEESFPREEFESWVLQLANRIQAQITELQGIPAGPTRARILHARIQESIDVFFAKSPVNKKMVSCFGCKFSGCCHTNVDITTDEAALYAEKIKSGEVPINHQRLNRQAAVSDKLESGEKFDEWGKLSFDERRCVFLSPEGRCRIYDDRPFVCRKWYVAEEHYTCDDYNGTGLIQVIQRAEELASAAFSFLESGRLPGMVKKALEANQ